MAAERFTFYLSFLEQINKMPEEDQLSAYRAICEYALLGKEPDFSQDQTAYADIVFTGIRPILDSGKRKAENGRKGGAGEAEEKRSTAKEKQSNVLPGSKPVQNRSKPKTKPKQTESKTEANVKLLEEEVEKEKEVEVEKEIETEGENTNVRIGRPMPTESDAAAEFEQIWERYPKKTGKKEARSAYIAARTRKKNPVSYFDVEKGVRGYAAQVKAMDTEDRFILGGARFFRQARWEDDFSHRPRARDGFTPNEYDWDQLEKDVTT